MNPIKKQVEENQVSGYCTFISITICAALDCWLLVLTLPSPFNVKNVYSRDNEV